MQAYAMGLAPASRLEHEVEMNIDILLLVTFMVACIHFLKNLLLWIFTNLMIKVESKIALSVSILLTSAIMSAFMDALSVAAVLISVCSGVLEIYLKAVGSDESAGGHDEHGTHEVMDFELKPGTVCVSVLIPAAATIYSLIRSTISKTWSRGNAWLDCTRVAHGRQPDCCIGRQRWQ